jgi:hypothetical protein
VSELVFKDAGGVTRVGCFRLTRTAMSIEGDPTYEEWQEFGRWLQTASEAINWWVGRWLNYGEAKWGEMFSQAIEATGMDYGTLRNIKWTESQFDLSRRRDKLTFSHHSEVASLPPKVADKILDTAEELSLTRNEVRALVSKWKREQAGETEMPFLPATEMAEITKWLLKRWEGWPEEYRPTFTTALMQVVENLERQHEDHGREGTDSPDSGSRET